MPFRFATLAAKRASMPLRIAQGQRVRASALTLPEAPRAPDKDDPTPEGWMARDGFHPGLLGDRRWGRQAADASG